MPSFSQRTLYLSLSAIVLVFLTALTLTPRPNLDTLSIPSPFAQSHDQSSHPCSHIPQQQGPLSHHDQQQQKQQQQPTWLLATISAYPSQRRRNIIRATWQTLYPNPAFDTRFVIAKPSPLWQPLIKHENDTYGDLIVLEHLEESAKVANTVKSVEFLKLVVEHSEALGAQQAPWQFVSKIDDDGFLDAERFYQEFIIPRLQTHRRPTATTTPNESDSNDNNNNGTVIARRLIRPDRPFSTPGGQFYTLSFDLVRLIASTHAANPISDLAEDVLIGRLLYEAKANFEFVELDVSCAFVVSEDGVGRLSKGDNVEVGPMDGRALNPHKMKDDEMYLRVAGLFGVEGFVGGIG